MNKLALFLATISFCPTCLASSGSWSEFVKKPVMQWTDPARLPKGQDYGPPEYVPAPNRTGNREEESQGIALGSPQFVAWIAELCKLPADNLELSERKKAGGAWVSVQKPKNALGTLLLLLENYESDVIYISSCREQRKLMPSACRAGKPGPVPGRTLEEDVYGFGSAEGYFQAQHTSASRLELKALRENYGALREIGNLNGSSSSATLARKIRHAAEYTATCRIRAIDTAFTGRKLF